jgi:hypothetical protein
MLNVLLGLAVFGATALGFWKVLPINGKLNPLLGPQTEILAAIALVMGAAFGLGCMIVGVSRCYDPGGRHDPFLGIGT